MNEYNLVPIFASMDIMRNVDVDAYPTIKYQCCKCDRQCAECAVSVEACSVILRLCVGRMADNKIDLKTEGERGNTFLALMENF